MVIGARSEKGLYPIGRCNNCMWYFHDEDELVLVQIKGEHINACPTCKTDEYLMDMPEIEKAVNSFEALRCALVGAQSAIRKALPFVPADNEALYLGEWLDSINEALILAGCADVK